MTEIIPKGKLIQKLRIPKIIGGVILGLLINSLWFIETKALFGIGTIASKAIYQILNWVAIAISFVASQIIALEAKLLGLIIDASVFTKMPVVTTGWRVARDFANMLFIAILVYVAFCYILRLQSKGSKALLAKVIIMAILINFSLMIGGIIIDFSNLFFRYFIFGSVSPSSDSGLRFTNTLADALRLQTLTKSLQKTGIDTPTASSTISEWQSWINIQQELANEQTLLIGFVNLIFTLIFSFLVIIVLGALALILFVRLFWLWILLILAPLAWMLSLVSIPGTPGGLAKQWWGKFLQWSFVAPVMGFFIYLALETAKNVQQLSIPGKFAVGGIGVVQTIQEIMQMFLVCGFLIAGLIAGQKMGASIAGSALGIAAKAGTRAKTAITDRASLAALRAGRTVAGGVEKASSKSNVVRTVASLTGAGAASRSISRKADEAEKEEWVKRTKKYESVNTDQLNAMKDSALMPAERAAMYSVLAKRDKLKEQDVDKAIPLLSKYDKETYKETIEKHPEWDPEIRSAAKTGDVSNVSKILEAKNIDSSKLNISKIADPIVLEAAIKFKIQTDPEEAAKSLRNLNLGTLNKYSSQIKEEFNKLDDITKQEFLKKLQSGLSGRIWAANNLLNNSLNEEPTIISTDSRGNPIK